MIDAQHEDHLRLMADELYNAGIRLNQKRPDVVVKRTGQGGIVFTSTTKLTHIDEEMIKSIASEYVTNAEIIIRENVTEDRFIDVFIENRVYVPAIVIINKTDLLPYVDFDMEKAKEYALRANHHLSFFEMSVKSGDGLTEWYNWLKEQHKSI